MKKPFTSVSVSNHLGVHKGNCARTFKDLEKDSVIIKTGVKGRFGVFYYRTLKRDINKNKPVTPIDIFLSMPAINRNILKQIK